VLVLGTGTGVGKTWVAAGLIRALRQRGVAVAARKPAQSFDAADDPGERDADVLGRASGEPPHTVIPRHRWYPVAMAPPMAAASLGSPAFSVGDLLAELRWPASAEPVLDGPSAVRRTVGVVELAGGVRSPQASDGDGVDVWRRIRPQTTVVVADAGLGTINAVRLTVDALTVDALTVDALTVDALTVDALNGHDRGSLAGAVVVLNRFDAASELHRRNRQWLDGYLAGLGVPVLVTPGDEDLLASQVLARPQG
jgi:dethiobiotin synthetase